MSERPRAVQELGPSRGFSTAQALPHGAAVPRVGAGSQTEMCLWKEHSSHHQPRNHTEGTENQDLKQQQ